MSKPDALATITQHAADRIAKLSPKQLAAFEMLTVEKAAEKGESVAAALGLIDFLKTLGTSGSVGSDTPAADKTVENREQEKNITEKLAANGKTQEQIDQDVGVLKWAGALMAGIGVTQAQGSTVTPVSVPNVAEKDRSPSPGG